MLNQQQFSEYDERPDPKGPGQQGVLFRSVAPAMGANRWPKGYSPERKQEVQSAMPANYGPSQEAMSHPSRPVNPGHEKDRIVQAIARSDIPAEHLQGLKSITTGTGGFGSGEYDYAGGVNVGGTFTGKSMGPPKTQKFREQFQDSSAQRVMLHEIGHHVTPDAHMQNPGVAEAVAENYADVHHSSPGPAPRSSYDTAVRDDKQLKRKWGQGSVKQYKNTRTANTQPETLQPLQFKSAPESSSGYNKFGFPI